MAEVLVIRDVQSFRPHSVLLKEHRPVHVDVTGIPTEYCGQHDLFDLPRDIYYFENRTLSQWLTVFHVKVPYWDENLVEFRRGFFEVSNPHLQKTIKKETKEEMESEAEESSSSDSSSSSSSDSDGSSDSGTPFCGAFDALRC